MFTPSLYVHPSTFLPFFPRSLFSSTFTTSLHVYPLPLRSTPPRLPLRPRARPHLFSTFTHPFYVHPSTFTPSIQVYSSTFTPLLYVDPSLYVYPSTFTPFLYVQPLPLRSPPPSTFTHSLYVYPLPLRLPLHVYAFLIRLPPPSTFLPPSTFTPLRYGYPLLARSLSPSSFTLPSTFILPPTFTPFSHLHPPLRSPCIIYSTCRVTGCSRSAIYPVDQNTHPVCVLFVKVVMTSLLDQFLDNQKRIM